LGFHLFSLSSSAFGHSDNYPLVEDIKTSGPWRHFLIRKRLDATKVKYESVENPEPLYSRLSKAVVGLDQPRTKTTRDEGWTFPAIEL